MGGELQARHFPGLLRAHVVAPENVRIGNLMLDHRLERAAARQRLLDLEAADRADRKAKFGKTKATADLFDLVLNAESLTSEQMAEMKFRLPLPPLAWSIEVFSPRRPNSNCSFKCVSGWLASASCRPATSRCARRSSPT